MINPPSLPATPNSPSHNPPLFQLMAHTSLAPFFHHKKIFHIIEIHNHCESKYEYRKMFRGFLPQCCMGIKTVHIHEASPHTDSTH